MSDEINKFYTETPLLDEIYYNCEIMARGTILKNEDEANNNETIESRKNADRYIMSIENKAKFRIFNYTEEEIRNVILMASDEQIAQYVEDNSTIPEEYRSRLLENAKKNTINNYNELNNYYRKLAGLPDLYDDGIYISSIDLTKIPPDNMIDLSKTFLHELNASDIELLESYNIISNLKSMYPDKKYLDYLGTNKISIYEARKANKFSALKIPYPPSAEIYSRYCYFIEKNRVYTLKAIYNEAFKYNSPYYDNVMMILIIIETIVDCISELPEYYIRRDFFDERTIRFMFESYGITYFEDIPLKYQKAMCKNINKLIKYSGSDKGIADICSIFGFENIEIFKYYLMKERKIGEDGKHIYPSGEVTDPNQIYDLKFLKVPIDGIADDYAKIPSCISDYDSVISGDKYWNGVYSGEDVKRKILEKEFNIDISKYISIDTMYELSNLSFDLPYFINMIMFCDDISKEKLVLTVPSLSENTKFNLVDLFIYLYSLMYLYLGIEDKIFKSETQVMSVKGFNFDVDLPDLYNYLLQRGASFESLGVPEFLIPLNGEINSFSQLMNIFIKNKNVSNIVVNGMINATDKREYELYKKIYDSLFITELSWEYYNIPEGNDDYTYTDFLSTKNNILYNSIMSLKSIGNVETRRTKISSYITQVISVLENAINSESILNNALSNIPTVSVDYIKIYLQKVINFFKSYKLSILEINTIYRFDDKLDNKIFILDEYSSLISTFDKSDIIHMKDVMEELTGTFDFKDRLEYEDFITEITRIYFRDWKDNIDMVDNIDITIIKLLEDYFNPIVYGKADENTNYTLKDFIDEIIYTYDKRDNFKVLDEISKITAYMKKSEYVNLDEHIEITKTYN